MYESPTITELGSVEEFTRGPGGGRFDHIIGVVVGVPGADGDGGLKFPWTDWS